MFNLALATLQRNLEKIEVSRSDVDCAAKYLRSVVDFYMDEAQRQKAIMKLIDETIGRRGEWGFALDWADGIKANGCWWRDLFLLALFYSESASGLRKK